MNQIAYVHKSYIHLVFHRSKPKCFDGHGIKEREYILFLAGVYVQQTIFAIKFELLDL